MEQLLLSIWLLFNLLFQNDMPVTPILACASGKETNTAMCSYSGYYTPGFPTRDTWIRNEDTPKIFYGRAIPYAEGIMTSTALTRGFEQKYLSEFDCLVSGFFINDVGRVAWVLHEEASYMCLVVDNSRPRDLYETVIHNREAIEIEYTFAKDIFGSIVAHVANPIIIVAYQTEKPTPHEWIKAQRLDKYLFDNWETAWDNEPSGYIKINDNQETSYMIDQSDRFWTKIPDCLYCNDNTKYGNNQEFKKYTAVYGDSLDKISKKMYGYSHPIFWEAIYLANSDQMNYLTHIVSGMVLDIPIYKEDELP